ncbi:clavaminate synthase-like protein At3g21360 [Macadamia integrifolia]|uniref:clavaminate synthase-like protein At3g21360 n=1 Tax=Macadamia integrifolia TaxID=60698 RepID=UPI001C4F0A91|nr:clavaminate synthase-like protein At3g21360 [Macadamia integrifolia]
MEFVEGRIEEEKKFGGVVFPKTLNPPKNGEGIEYGSNELIEMVKAKREWVEELLQRHSAILFRGFRVNSAEEFGGVVEAFGWEEMEYWGVASRLKIADRVHTTNEAPPEKFIIFHHEMSLTKDCPSKLFFFCSQPPPAGGETLIVPSPIVVEKMEERLPEFVAELMEKGCVFGRSLPKENDIGIISGRSWKWFLQTEDQDEAKQTASERLRSCSINFNKDGSADLVHGPLNPIQELEGKRVWFNTILGYTSNEKDMKVTFGDGSALPAEAFEVFKDILDENCVDIKWQKGDVLLLDNFTVQHARRPGKPPRTVLVSVCK